jgi:hypothetical protein
MVPAEPRNKKNGAWKRKDDENTFNNAEGIQNPEKQLTPAVGKQSNGKCRVISDFWPRRAISPITRSNLL